MSIGIFSSALLGVIAGATVDAKPAEQHNLTATPANFAIEDGSTVTDHIVLNPATIEIPWVLSNQDTSFGTTGSSYGIRSATLYNVLRENLSSRTLYTVVTRHVLYQNMALVEIPADHTAPKQGTLEGTAKFQQINQPSLQNVKIPTSQLAQDGTQFKASSAIPAGTQILKDVDNSPSLLDQANSTWGT